MNPVPTSTTTPVWYKPPVGLVPSHPETCACPVCVNLKTYVRPRFFAGQLLTDSELTSLTSYVVDKERLHNLYLHGWGVVCGLQVECDGCGPGVLVHPGYAIDPCGYDIVVPCATRIDVLELIAQCQTKMGRLDCDPPRYPVAQGCDEAETWCLYVRYKEQQARPVTPLGGSAATSCSCGTKTSSCGCGGKTTSSGSGCGCGCTQTARAGWECTCGSNGSRSTTTCGCSQAPASSTSTPNDCEPSRTYECYEFGVCKSDGSCSTLGDLAGTFPVQVVECITKLRPVLSKGLTPAMQRNAAALLLGGRATEGSSEVLCTLYRNVAELYRKDPLHTGCILPQRLSQIDCSPQAQDESTVLYANRLGAAMYALGGLAAEYLRDCLCYNMMPPCPPAPCDDRVVLACMTVKNGAVVSICNFDCRRYAGSFVSRNYWLPIGPLLTHLGALLCCFPLLERPPRQVGNDVSYTGGRFSALFAAVRRDDFALVKMWRTRLGDLAGRFRPTTVLDKVESTAAATAEQVPLADYVGQPVDTAVAALESQRVTAHTVEVADPSSAPIGALIPAVAAGGAARLYVHNGQVVAAEPAEAQAAAEGTTP
jgi:hypothetical protein